MEIDFLINELLTHPDALIRKHAAEALGQSEHYQSNAIEAVTKGLLDTDKGVKDVCARILSYPQEHLALETSIIVAPLTKHIDIEVRNLACDILLKIGPVATQALLPYLNDEEAQVRQFCLDIIGRYKLETVPNEIFKLLYDEDNNVKSSAVEALGNQKSGEAVDELFAIYQIDEDLRPIIIESMGKIGTPKAQNFLVKRLRDEKDIFLQTACIDALALCGEDVSICESLLNDLLYARKELQTTILKTIYAIACRVDYQIKLNPKQRVIAIEALFDDDADIRAAGLIALGDTYYKEDVPGLISEVLRENPETQAYILVNLIQNSDYHTIQEFFTEYCPNSIADGSDVLFLSHIHHVKDLAPDENIKAVIEIVLNNIFSKARTLSIEIIELLYGFSPEKINNYLLNVLNQKDYEILDLAMEIIHKLQIIPLFEIVKIKASNETEFNERYAYLIQEMND